MNSAIVLWVILGVLGVAGIAAFMRSTREKVLGLNKNLVALVLVGLAVIGGAQQLGYTEKYGLAPLAIGGSNSDGTQTSSGTVIAGYQPTATFTTKDKFANTVVSGTAYYKSGSQSATTTAVSNTNPGTEYKYWVDNSTYYVMPVTLKAQAGVTAFEAVAFQNGTATITGYDMVNRESVGAGAYNTSMSANDQANIEFTYQGTAKKSAMPFGGVIVLEYNSTISSVTCTGDDLLADNPYHLTYTVTHTASAYKSYAFGSTLDDGSGNVRKITCQYQNGATAPGAGSTYYLKFFPANYYVSQNGNILLDTEKYADSATTRTGTMNTPVFSALWSA